MCLKHSTDINYIHFWGLDCNIFENCLCRSAGDFSAKPYILSFFYLKNYLKEKSELQSLFILYTDLKLNKLNSWHKCFFLLCAARLFPSNRKAWANASGQGWFWLREADCTLMIFSCWHLRQKRMAACSYVPQWWEVALRAHFLDKWWGLESGNSQSTGLHWSASRLRWCYIK